MKKNNRYCYIYLNDIEQSYYGPKHQPDYISAMNAFEKDVKEAIKSRGFKQSELWLPGYNEIKRRIRELWQQ